jgi:hypothetical protein
MSDIAAALNALERLVREFDDLDEHRPLHVGCIQCTWGATPDRYNTGPCAYHSAKALLASTVIHADEDAGCEGNP